MAISEKELKQLNRHCTCGKPNFVFIKHYTWRDNSEKPMSSGGIFAFCYDEDCFYYFKHFITLDQKKSDGLGGLFYYTATNYPLEKIM